MTWIDDITPAYATVTGRFISIGYDSVDEDLNPDVTALTGTLVLTPTTADGRIASAYAWIRPVEAAIYAGEIVPPDDGDALRILATDAPIGVEGWAWRASITLADGPRIRPFTFLAPAGTTVDLTGTDLIPVTSNPVTVIAPVYPTDWEQGEGQHEGHFRWVMSDGTTTSWLPSMAGEPGPPGPAGVAEVEYDGSWPARPDVDRSITWISTKHRAAPYPPTQPTDPDGMAIGDRLIRHPEAT